MYKKSASTLLAVLLFLTTGCFRQYAHAALEDDGNPPRLRRSESFLGIHFDFHAGDGDKEIGKTVTPEMVENIIDKVHPDYIQIDCKGHAGCSSYPTKVGNQAGGFVKDTLKIWREVTARRGVALYMHYSGVWDSKVCQLHPEWAVVNPDRSRSDRYTSVFGPYKDELLIPQLKELTDVYNVDGYWIDGECWATQRDASDEATRRFTEETGITEIPKQPSDPHWYEWSQFHREAFRKYLRHYTRVMHQHNPDIQICSNWAFTSFMPEPVSVDFDFISGDYPLQDSVREGRFEARCIRLQGKPWDLMAWGFSSTWDDIPSRCTKSPVQLQREAAVVLACGGGFQAYFTQNRDGSIRPWHMNVMAEVAQFCRARQKFCHRAESVPQIALLYSTDATYRKSHNLFHHGSIVPPIKGILYALLDNQYHVDITMDHHLLRGQAAKYPLIVIPEWEYLAEELKNELRTYLKAGGNLLIIGPRSAKNFQDELGITSMTEPAMANRWLAHQSRLGGLHTLYSTVGLAPDAEPIGKLYDNDDFNSSATTVASMRRCGQGQIAAVYANLGQRYRDAKTAVSRDFLGSLVQKMMPRPIVEVSGSHYVDVVINRIRGQLAVNLINTAGPHANKEVYTFDEIPPLGPLDVKIRTEKRPKKVTLEPEGRTLKYGYRNGVVELTLPRLEIHDIILVH